MAKAVFGAMNVTPKIQYVDIPDNISRQYQNFTEADMSKFKAAMPSFSFRSLEDGVTDYITNHLAMDWPFY
jgi:ADP-L-glycero-D-manno-heptose 6-epimerase